MSHPQNTVAGCYTQSVPRSYTCLKGLGRSGSLFWASALILLTACGWTALAQGQSLSHEVPVGHRQSKASEVMRQDQQQQLS